MIYFITNNEYYKKNINTEIFTDITILNEIEGNKLFFSKFHKCKILALDIEANGLDAHYTTPILYGLGTKNNFIMFDYTIDLNNIFNYIEKRKIILLGHNIKYDIKLIRTNYNIMFKRLYDTMIAEQRLFMGMDYSFSLASVIERYLKKFIIKATRNEFIGVDVKEFKITVNHLYYLKNDLIDLFYIRKKQQELIKRNKQEFLIYGIEFPLIPIIAEAEVTGFKIDKEEFLKVIENNKLALFNQELALDEELQKLIKLKADKNIVINSIPVKTLFSGIKYSKRVYSNQKDFFNKTTVNQNNLFDEIMTVNQYTGIKTKPKFNSMFVDYNKKAEIVDIFGKLKEPLITDAETYLVPQFNNKLELINNINTFSIKANLLHTYLIQRPDTIMKNFINLLIKYNQIQKEISTYGKTFLDNINSKTGKLHTTFRQATAKTGRFQSGGGDNEPDKYNAQNIPRDNKYRNCFIADEGYSILTADYSGAELIVMCSKAQDHKLLELSKKDMHSHMATICWKNIFKHRHNNLLKIINNPNVPKEVIKEAADYELKSLTFTVDKTMKERTAFKPMTFGIIYGMYAKKAGATLNISVEEGKIVINTIEKEIPATINMVKTASKEAKAKGYIILNSRTNSRIYYPALIKLLRKEISEDTHFIEISSALSSARNGKIQGTQADFIKEASVQLYKFFNKCKLDIKILSWVHDEFVIHLPDYLISTTDEGKAFYDKTTLTYKGRSVLADKEIINILKETANKYLTNVEIDVEYSIAKHWLK